MGTHFLLPKSAAKMPEKDSSRFNECQFRPGSRSFVPSPVFYLDQAGDVAGAEWLVPSEPPVKLTMRHDGAEAEVIIPEIAAWDIGWLKIP